MDIETSGAIESLRGDIRRVEATLSAEIGKLRAQMVTRDEFATGLAKHDRLIAGLATRDELETALAKRDHLIAGLATRDELETALAKRDHLIAGLATRDELETGLASVRNELASTRDELKRHTDMRFESLHDDIRIIAEGFASLNARMDRAL
jgi:hypothetical protein